MPDPEPIAADGATDALARAVGGARDAEGFAEIWRRVSPAVFAWASLSVRAALHGRLDPQDLLQEVAVRAWARFDGWDPLRGTFRNWVFGIARHVLHEGLRRLAVAGTPRGAARFDTAGLAALPDSATGVTRAVARDEGLRRLLNEVQDLPGDERRLLLLRGLEGLTHAQVADVLATTPDAVAKRWQRLCDRLRRQPRWVEILVA